jgi:hypothetical protein
VATDKGDYVLDNLSGEIRSWGAAGYTWIERQDSTNPTAWVTLLPAYAAQQSEQPTTTGSANKTLSSAQQATPQTATSSTVVANNDNSSKQLPTVSKAAGTAQ